MLGSHSLFGGYTCNSLILKLEEIGIYIGAVRRALIKIVEVFFTLDWVMSVCQLQL